MANHFFLSGLSLPSEMPTTWWEWILFALAVIFGVFLVKVTVQFDLNVYLKDRSQRRIARLQNACTHLVIEPAGEGQMHVTSCFQSPPGTVQYFCSRCQVMSYNPEREFSKRTEYYIQHLSEYYEAEERFIKMLRRAGYSD